MKIVEKSIANPSIVAVVVAIVLFLGGLSILRLPVQLFPNIERPVISVQASWRAASPREVESELVEPIEEVLQGIPGMLSLRSRSNSGRAWINMEFGLQTNIDQALIEVISRLNRLPPLPADADPPRVNVGGGGGGGDTLLWLFAQRLPNTSLDQAGLRTVVRDELIPELEAIEGVASVDFRRGQGAKELQVVFDPYRAAQLGVNLNQLAQRVGRANDVSGGTIREGSRQYALRFSGRYDVDQLRDLIVDWRNDTPIRLSDIADIRVGESRNEGLSFQNGNPAVGMRLIKTPGANVLTTIDKVTEVVDRLNGQVLADAGVTVHKSFDPSVFIKRAIGLLSNNLMIGMILAVTALWWFLRQGRATLLIATTIPICMAGTFVVLSLFGRSVNVISLAGLAFATGMVLDAAIVVLENIVRLRESGERMRFAANVGAEQVWGALVASVMTTVMVFTPIIFLRDVEGQLFADLALTIAIAVVISLVVAVTVLPAAAARFLRRVPDDRGQGQWWTRIADRIVSMTNTRKKQVFWIVGLIAVPIILTVQLWPATNYLPPVKRDAIDAFVRFPSGSTVETIESEYIDTIISRLAPYMSGEKEPALRNYYFNVFGGGGAGDLGVRVKDQNRVGEMRDIVQNEILAGLPGIQAFAQQGNLFGGFGGDSSIEIELSGPNLNGIALAAVDSLALIDEALPGVQARLEPDPRVVLPEIRLIPNDRRIAELGLTREQVSGMVRALGDGLWLGEHFDGESRLDIIMRASEWRQPETLSTMPVALPGGGIATLGDLVTIRRDVGPTNIQRVNNRRTISIELNPPDGLSLEETVNTIKSKIEPELKAMLPAGSLVNYGGSADSLSQAIATIGSNFLVAVALLFLMMSALFRSLRDALIVVITLPMATVGGVLGMKVLNLFNFSPLDLLGMIGFIITLGLVVNNAILLVAQTRRCESDGMARKEAVRTALRLRLRPIFMSTLTSIVGMLPLVLVPGAGSLIYRGMAVVIVGGMSVSMIFTLVLLPSLLLLQLPGRRRAEHQLSETQHA